MEQMSQSGEQLGYWQFPVKLTTDDMIAYNRVCAKGQRSTLVMYYLIFIACAFFVGAVASTLGFGSTLDIASFWFNLLGTVALYCLVIRFYSKIYYRNLWPEGSFALADKMVTFSPEGLYVEQQNSAGVVRWPLIANIMRDKIALYLMIDTRHGYMIPYRCLPHGLTPDVFEYDLKTFRENFRE